MKAAILEEKRKCLCAAGIYLFVCSFVCVSGSVCIFVSVSMLVHVSYVGMNAMLTCGGYVVRVRIFENLFNLF